MAEKRALTRNASDAQQVKRAGKVERIRQQQDDDRLGFLCDLYEGRAILWRVLERTGLYHQTHRGESTHETAFLNGERNIGLWLLADIMRVNAPAYAKMQTEAQEREATIAEPPARTDEPFEGTDGNDTH